MKKINSTLIIIFALLLGCSPSTSFEDIWIEEDKQNKFLTINSVGDDLYSVDYSDESYSAQLESKNLINLLDSDLSILYNPKESKIVFDGKKYIRYKGTYGEKFLGDWTHPEYGGWGMVTIQRKDNGYIIKFDDMTSGAWAEGSATYVKYEDEDKGNLEGFWNGAGESGKWSEKVRIYLEDDGLIRLNDWDKLKKIEE